MGLFAIAIRDRDAASEIPMILAQHGYVVTYDREDETARFFACADNGLPLSFWITKGSPPRFCIGVGRRGHEAVKILAAHGVFEELIEPGSQQAS
jgi:hypothetical protein